MLDITVQDVISSLEKPASALESTVDKIVCGRSDELVQGIAVSFSASYEALERAAELGANLFITHEGLFYSHHDGAHDMLKADPVYQAKQALIKARHLTVYRFHDYPHRYNPDEITDGLIEAIGYAGYVVRHLSSASIIHLPAGQTVRQITEHIKSKLQLSYVRVIGNMEMMCERIGIAVGYRGGGPHLIPMYENEQLQLIIAGEGPEWETPEYIRDALALGGSKSLILTGHAASEEPGMKRIADRISQRFPNVPVHFIPAVPIFQVV
ncbi:Nif3-like dinuclear metal center hexameric protein [Paenibacillus provencensis]|uniref:GTP cyclohydrolase 1 type 2 homolog n=1 Tax=Paenibacillus provencensis TaxID=441151 RepID=A0ABW3Q5Q2_9BACL|nr:Nif3-like dinuclear metal center hexameric protein [Paenibacillus sp. MER 78]MCM3127881.1 Nif3-like dinuclear metal center hexameric protein [Paenibacillus sp. MER 78]